MTPNDLGNAALTAMLLCFPAAAYAAATNRPALFMGSLVAAVASGALARWAYSQH